PYLLGYLNDGALLFSFQGHANRAHLSSESGFSMFSQYRDLNSLTSARNFVFMGAGCHISQFALLSELGRLTDGPNGDCITEQMLFRSVSGAVSTYASTGFEVLDQNEYFFDRLHTFIFQTPPADSIPPDAGGTGAHWVFGKMITMAEIEHIGATYYGFDQTYRYLILGDPMLDIDPGPPNMVVEADWGEGFAEMGTDTLRSGNSSNTGTIRFTATDVIALGGVTLAIDGEDRTGDLTISRSGDPGLTWPRSWEAQLDYTVSLDDNSLVFSVLSPGGETVGTSELTIGIGMRLFHGDDEIISGGEAPSQGEFRLLIDLPVFLDQPPVLELDGIEFTGASLNVPQGSDSVFWEALFTGDFSAGTHTFTVVVGQHEADFVFTVGGAGFLVESYSFPNPFTEGTNICFTLNFPADSGSISIYNVSGRLIRTISIPSDMLGEASSLDQPNHVYWDGRDLAGDRVANGSYIVLLDISRDGQDKRIQSISVKLE
ncbi:MAG TPA: C25 family cysteine peptidase, partial [Candidatus Krumholzibacterium sp.]|nr:C25 family cysteine peptidase [Candidatus Krumholzibacterium sp.]